MLDLTWKVFCMTGNVDTYLLLKEMEKDEFAGKEAPMDEEQTEADASSDAFGSSDL